jgi:hypothetical protein
LHEEGIDYISVDPDYSVDKWTVVEKGENRQKILVGPLTNINGIGPKKLLTILDARKTGEDLSKTKLWQVLRQAKTKIDSLTPIDDSFRKKFPTKEAVETIITSDILKVKEVQPGVNGNVVIVAVADKIVPSDDNAPVKVAQRGYAINGTNTTSLNLFVSDDTDNIMCKIHRRDYEKMGRKVFEQGGAGKAMYAIRGNCPDSFRMIWVNGIKYLGDFEE